MSMKPLNTPFAVERPARDEIVSVRVADVDHEIALSASIFDLVNNAMFDDVSDAGKIRALRHIADRLEEDGGEELGGAEA